MSDRQERPAPAGSTVRVSILDVSDDRQRRDDSVAAEEPLEIRVVAGEGGARETQSIAITMRTPGHDFELAAGFLLSEGVLSRREDLWRLARCEREVDGGADNIVEAHLAPAVDFDAGRFSRHVYTTSSCGICGKASIEILQEVCPPRPRSALRVSSETVRRLPGILAEKQTVFTRTGGLHAAGLFDSAGAFVRLREDVGRHNALDKLVGAGFLEGEVPLSEGVLLVSGRASFELVQKALMAGIPALLAVGAPSSLAVSTAREFGMTLVGFLKPDSFNVYSGEERIVS